MSDSLLTTKAAARLLNVSEASVRRWSDAGLLPVKRVGRRRARRFEEPDVLRFRARDTVAGRPSDEAGALGRQPHQHLATFYDSETARLRVSVPFLLDGIRAGEPCFLVVREPVRDLYMQALRNGAPQATEAAIEQERLSVLPGVGPLTRDALAMWEERFTQALDRGARLLRVVGEMASERRSLASDGEMIDYEYAFNAISLRFPTVAICQYDVREFSGNVLLGALKAHPDMLGSGVSNFLL